MDQPKQDKKVPNCQQILTSGHRCKCPALRTAVLCYYHQRDLQRRRILEKAREVKRNYAAHRESRPEDELSTEIVESLALPALDDRASIQVACTNIMRAAYCDHISLAKARIMMRAVTEANLNIRRGRILDEYKQPILDADPEPIQPMGDSDGCVLPEERMMKKAIVDIRRTNAERADADIAAARARGEDPAPRPLTPEEEKRAALQAARAAHLQEADDFWAEAMAVSPPDSDQLRHAQHQRALIAAEIAAQAGEPVPPPAGMPVPQTLSEGHGFTGCGKTRCNFHKNVV